MQKRNCADAWERSSLEDAGQGADQNVASLLSSSWRREPAGGGSDRDSSEVESEQKYESQLSRQLQVFSGDGVQPARVIVLVTRRNRLICLRGLPADMRIGSRESLAEELGPSASGGVYEHVGDLDKLLDCQTRRSSCFTAATTVGLRGSAAQGFDIDGALGLVDLKP